jgi:hypothetical protein
MIPLQRSGQALREEALQLASLGEAVFIHHRSGQGTAFPLRRRTFVAPDVHWAVGKEARDVADHLFGEIEGFGPDVEDVIRNAPARPDLEWLAHVAQLRVRGDDGLRVTGQIDFGDYLHAPFDRVLSDDGEIVRAVRATVGNVVITTVDLVTKGRGPAP